ncbi:MAG: AMP-binding protein, partial [Deltaproteobacteria bacterium]|nr:AMP-binding protein [Deltaproteobacteria bacterium]
NLNFTAGREAIGSAIEQCGIKTILTSRAFLSKANLEKMEGMVFLEDIMAGIRPFDKAFAALSAFILPHRLIQRLLCRGKKDHNELAAIIFTTGSTGIPKGVMLTHHNIISNIEGFSQVFSLSKDDTLIGALPFFHSFGFTGTIWFPLLCGFSAVYHPNPLDARTIGELAREHKATILIGTPTFYSSYIKKCAPGDFKSVRYAIAGAEKLRENVAKEFMERFGIELLEGYGCTELSPVISVNFPDVEYNGLRQKGSERGTVGHPIPGVSVRVVDIETGQSLSSGKEGLLLVKGPNLMKGYLNQPDKTAQAIKDGWYITGDIASIGEDGFIKITDRLSRFSKIGGEMVPHIKIEETLAGVIGCDCAITAIADEGRGERIVAFYTGDTSPAEVWERLGKTELPKLWIPKREALFRVGSIPVTAAGKVDLMKVKALALEMTGV